MAEEQAHAEQQMQQLQEEPAPPVSSPMQRRQPPAQKEQEQAVLHGVDASWGVIRSQLEGDPALVELAAFSLQQLQVSVEQVQRQRAAGVVHPDLALGQGFPQVQHDTLKRAAAHSDGKGGKKRQKEARAAAAQPRGDVREKLVFGAGSSQASQSQPQ